MPDRIVDAHHQVAPLDTTMEAFGQTVEEHHVQTTVLVQPRPDSTESDRVLDVAEGTPFVGVVVVWMDVTAADIEANLDAAAKCAKFRGLCLSVSDEADNRWLLRDEVVHGLRAVAGRGLSVDLIVAPRQLPAVRELAGTIPNLRIVLDHIGSPFIAKSEREPWGVHMLNVAPYQNVYAKLSGLVTLDTQPDWRVSHIRLFVGAMVRLFGYERMMFGSDWPMHTQVADYAQVMEAMVDAAGPMTPAQYDQLMGGTAREFYRLR